MLHFSDKLFYRPIAAFAAFFVAFLSFAPKGWSQQPGSENARDINNYELSRVLSLLQDWQHTFFYDMQEDPWEQNVQLDENSSMIFYKLRPYSENNTSDNWFVSHHIPLLCIDTITMNYKDSSITFFVKGNRIGAFQGGFRAAKNNKVSMHMKLPGVRNLPGQLLGHIRSYQLAYGKNKPATARQIVSEAVYDYINQRIYNTGEVKKLLGNQELYIGKCMICNGTQDGFRKYTDTQNITTDMTSQAHDLRVNLFWGKPDEQPGALEKLVEEAVKDYYENYNFSEEEISDMRSMLAAERKKSMGIAGGKKCPSCDGACKKED